MKSSLHSVAPFFLFLALLSVATRQCNSSKDTTYESLMAFADQVKVINTHEHQHWPEEYGELNFRLPHLIKASYVMADVISAGGPGMDWQRLDTITLPDYWNQCGDALNFTRNTSYYAHFIKGFRELYDFDDLYFSESNILDLSAQIETNYRDYRDWFDQAFHRAGFELMFLDQYWKPFNTEVDESYYALAFNINSLVTHVSYKPDGNYEGPELFQMAGREDFSISTLDDYLAYCEILFQRNLDKKAVCVKNSLAYQRSLDFEEVPYDMAKALFDRSSFHLTDPERKKLQDFMFHWIIQKSVEHGLPIQIHTGYLAGNGNTLDHGKPVKLNNLFLTYPEAKFVLFHGGYPWTGEYAALGKMFPNVYLDLVWLPQISREEAVHALDEMFDVIPYNKFFWGGDCSFIEESTGSLEFGKEVVAQVLTNRIERGLLTPDVAEDMISCVFRENAIRVFKLEEKLGRSFL